MNENYNYIKFFWHIKFWREKLYKLVMNMPRCVKEEN